jgi:hypothetical protein
MTELNFFREVDQVQVQILSRVFERCRFNENWKFETGDLVVSLMTTFNRLLNIASRLRKLITSTWPSTPPAINFRHL